MGYGISSSFTVGYYKSTRTKVYATIIANNYN